ncbi:MAG: hypothetical protein RL508_833 [Actinomycetota bacterium]|jgi:magnesium chelatase family protein
MALAISHSISLQGLDGKVVSVEVDISAQLPAFVLVGLPDASLSEATARVRAACGNSGFNFPSQKILVNLSPASVPKSGSSFDLAIAIGVLAAMGVVSATELAGMCLIGELALDGKVQPVLGLLPMLLSARNAGLQIAVVPESNLAEANLVDGIDVLGCSSLLQLVNYLKSEGQLVRQVSQPVDSASHNAAPQLLDLSQVVGQDEAVGGLIVAAAGGHHISMIGAPGSGKTMLAERLPTILPRLSIEESLEVAAVESIVGMARLERGLSLQPRFQAPHHSASVAAIIGGGNSLPKPGAVSKAHHGVLFLDEAPEFQVNVLEALRESLESGQVQVNRSAGSATFPAQFQLVLAANPCPCGNFGVIGKDCRCGVLRRRRYGARLSGPLRDRLDIRLDIQPISVSAVAGLANGVTTSAQALERVSGARMAAAERLSAWGYTRNAQMPGPILKANFNPGRKAIAQLDRHLAAGKTSMRGYDRCLRVAWTIADLEGATSPTAEHVFQAVTLRGPDQLMGEE